MRRTLIVLLAAAGVAALGSFAAWEAAERRMADELARWQDAMRAQGWTVTSAAPERSGWPLAAEQTLPDLAITGGGALGWHADRATLSVDLLHPGVAVLRITGTQRVRLSDAEARCTADRFAVTVPLDGGATMATLDAVRLRFGGVLDGMTVGSLQGEASSPPAGATALLRLSAEAIALPPPPAPQAALGARIASATAEFEARGRLPALDAPSAMAAAWRDAGGALVVRRIAVGWGPLGVTGVATLALDRELQPAGAATLRLVGLDEALGALVANHAISAAAAKAARAVLGLMVHPAADSGAAGVEVPLTLRDGTLSAGLFPLLRMPKLVWPDAPGSASVSP